jgi:predicted cupin superfamily sugar epimerase
MSAINIIKQFKLEPHPEGGYYAETYRSTQIVANNKDESRNISTAIYYLLEDKDKSHFHRILSDELWFFHQGEALEMLILNDNKVNTILIGNNIAEGEIPQVIIPANTWFAAKIKNERGYSLVSCTVAPGFNFLDFELAQRGDLIEQFPDQKSIIEEFTR